MKIANINITDKDIKEYLIDHKEDEEIKYNEALFLKYLKETSNGTLEKIEMSKTNDKEKEALYREYSPQELFTFQRYLGIIKDYKNIDINDIALMLVPALGLNEFYTGDINIGVNYICNYAYLVDDNFSELMNGLVYELREYSHEYEDNKDESIDIDLKRIGVLNDTIGEYAKLRSMGIIEYNGKDFSLIGKERCKKELEKYTSIYGKAPVEIVKEYVKKRKEEIN